MMFDVFGIKPATTCLQMPYLIFVFKDERDQIYTYIFLYIYSTYTQHHHTSSVVQSVWRCWDKLLELYSSGFFFSSLSKKLSLLVQLEVFAAKKEQDSRGVISSCQNKTVRPWSSTQQKDQLPEPRTMSIIPTIHQKW